MATNNDSIPQEKTNSPLASSPNPSPHFHLAVLILTSVIFLTVGLAIGYLLGRQVNPTSRTATNPNPTSTPQPVDSRSEWKTFVNSTHKYSVEYPSDWDINPVDAYHQEEYDDSACCKTATLTISKGETKWILRINALFTGFDAPDQCQPSPDKCTYLEKNLTVLGYPVTRVLTKTSDTNTFVEAFIKSTSAGATSQKLGFGEVGITTQYVQPTKTKYHLNYTGTDVETHLDTLDAISSSLKATP